MGEGAATARGVAQQTSRESTEADFWLFGYGWVGQGGVEMEIRDEIMMTTATVA